MLALLLLGSESSVFPSAVYQDVKIKIYKTIILPAALHGCETWSLTLGEETERAGVAQ
jgi:hypothetical protein